MRNKLVFFVFIIVFLIFSHPGVGEGNPSEPLIIPDEAIRLRILANSDTPFDQEIKLHIRDEVNEQISTWVEHLTDLEAARQLISNNIDAIEQTIENTLRQYNVTYDFQVSYQEKVLFPDKTYGNIHYPAGEYEAVLITLGSGEGKNWWCVLFPPLCFLDFATEVEAATEPLDEAETEDEEVEVKFFLLDWLVNLFE
ncbi:MAG TPA: stage II sporulation protein R [Cerasibacillus sp.]